MLRLDYFRMYVSDVEMSLADFDREINWLTRNNTRPMHYAGRRDLESALKQYTSAINRCARLPWASAPAEDIAHLDLSDIEKGITEGVAQMRVLLAKIEDAIAQQDLLTELSPILKKGTIVTVIHDLGETGAIRYPKVGLVGRVEKPVVDDPAYVSVSFLFREMGYVAHPRERRTVNLPRWVVQQKETTDVVS